MTSALLPPRSTGVNVEIRTDGSHLETAAELEDLGYAALWIAGGQLDRLDRVDELLTATTRVVVATGIVPLGVYDVAAIAALHARLTATAPGRFVLGLGGPQQAKPLTALGGYLDDLDHHGVGATQRLLAALGPKKLQIAGARSAGAITLLTTPEATADARSRIGPDPLLVVHQVVVLERDRDRGRAAAYPVLGFLRDVGGYRRAWRAMGFVDDEIDDLAPRFVDGVVAWGDEEHVSARVDAHRTAGADHVALSILGQRGFDQVAAARRLAGPTVTG